MIVGLASTVVGIGYAVYALVNQQLVERRISKEESLRAGLLASRSPEQRARVLSGALLMPGDAPDAENLLLLRKDRDQQPWLGALDGETGELLWKSSLTVEGLDRALRAVIGGTLLVAGERELVALDPSSGKVLWRRDTDGLPVELCAGNGYAGLTVVSQPSFVPFSVTTGDAARGSPWTCERVPSSNGAFPRVSVVDFRRGRAPVLDPPLPDPLLFATERALVLRDGGLRVLLGHDADGSPHVASASRSAWLWEAWLGRFSGRKTRLLSPPHAAVRNERVLVPYVFVEPPELRLANLELATGHRSWDVGLSIRDVDESAGGAELIISQAGWAYFSDGKGQLWAVSPDGRLAWMLGDRAE